MTRAWRRWKIVAISVAAFIAIVVVTAIIANAWYGATERTYYGPHSDVLSVGERVTFSEDFSADGQHRVAKAQTAIVQEERARDDDDCDPDRPIKVTLTSGELVTVPRHILHR